MLQESLVDPARATGGAEPRPPEGDFSDVQNLVGGGGREGGRGAERGCGMDRGRRKNEQ